MNTQDKTHVKWWLGEKTPWYNHHGWWAVISSAFAVLVSAYAVYTSHLNSIESTKIANLSYKSTLAVNEIANLSYKSTLAANEIANLSRKDIRAISGLDTVPIVTLSAEFSPYDNSAPYLIITNRGPIDIYQVEIEVIENGYDTKARNIRIGLTHNDAIPQNSRYKEKLVPHDKHISVIDKYRINSIIEINRMEKKIIRIIEIKFTYKRKPDMKQYTKRAFYFANPNNIWVAENDSSVNVEPFISIRKALSKQDKYISDMLSDYVKETRGYSDPLH